LVISNHNSFRELFDNIASVYFIWKIYLYFRSGNGQPREPALRQLYQHTFVPYCTVPYRFDVLYCITSFIYRTASRPIVDQLPPSRTAVYTTDVPRNHWSNPPSYTHGHRSRVKVTPMSTSHQYLRQWWVADTSRTVSGTGSMKRSSVRPSVRLIDRQQLRRAAVFATTVRWCDPVS